MHTHAKKVNIITLGCSKNIVDSEKLAGQLNHGGYHIFHNEEKGKFDTTIINTCGFIESAKQESINTILEWVEEKQRGNTQKLVVTGCLSHRYRDELSTEFTDVDAWFGTMELSDMLRFMQTDLKKNLVQQRHLSTPSHYAYLKISEGCNRTCSFCAIPLMRGNHVSKTIEELVEETNQLARNGVKEIMLIAQELTYYGLDIYKKRSLPHLLDELVKVDGIEWIRLHYAYPHKFPMDIIEKMSQHPKICNYLDMPLQHASDAVLTSMQRQITKKEMRNLLSDIRSIIPDIALRTTMLVGFPNETDDDFNQLLEFIQEQRFDRLGVFPYSHEEKTKAFEREDNISEQIKQFRYDKMMSVQQQISLEKNQQQIGKKCHAIIDKVEKNVCIGRSEKDSPEVDNEIFIYSADEIIRVGDFVEVEITDAFEYDVQAKFLKKI